MGVSPIRRGRISFRALSPFLLIAVLAWSAAAFLYAGSSPASASALPHFNDVEIDIMVPTAAGQWEQVRIEFFMRDDGTGNFAAEAAAARASMLARYPGAYEVIPGVTAAYVSNGFSWTSNSANWAYNGAGAPAGVSGSAAAAVSASASAWGATGTNFHFTGGGATANDTGACGGGKDGFNTVGWVQQSGNILAVTCSWFSGSSATEFDMQISPGWGWTTGASPNVDLQSVVTHEFGHALGLGHSAQSSAVMYYAYTTGTLKRTLTADDVEGETAVYGAAGGATPTATSTPTTAPTSTPTPTRSPSASPTATQTPTAFPTASSTSTSTPPPSPTNPPSTPTAQPTTAPAPTSISSPTAAPPAAATATTQPTASPTPTRTPTALATASPPSAATASPATQPPPSLPILPGANLLSWPGGDLPPAVALGSQAAAIRIIYQWDPETGVWQRFAPGLPSFLNNMPLLRKGQAYWFIANTSAQVPFAP